MTEVVRERRADILGGHMLQRHGVPGGRVAVISLVAMVSAPAHAARLFVSQAGLGPGGAAASRVVVDATVAADLAAIRRPVRA